MSSLVCTYASKPCSEPRAVKENGELHRLCEFHRDKANEAQRRWHARHQSIKRVRPTRNNSQFRRASEPSGRDTTPDATAWASPPVRRHQSLSHDLGDIERMPLVPQASYGSPSLRPPLATSEGGALSADDLALLSEILVDADDDDVSAKYEGYEFIV